MPAPHNLLTKKIERLLTPNSRGRIRKRQEFYDFMQHLRSVGEFALIGGAIRDLHLGGKSSFSSDLDFVVNPFKVDKFYDLLAEFPHTLNRLGGARIHLEYWMIDVWPLERTWAKQSAGISIDNFEDILKTTFFNWDAIAFNYATKKLVHRKNYFKEINARKLEINLSKTPNPKANVVRALRYAARWEASLGPKLVKLILKTLQSEDWASLKDYEVRKFVNPILVRVDEDHLLQELIHAAEIAPSGYFGPLASLKAFADKTTRRPNQLSFKSYWDDLPEPN